MVNAENFQLGFYVLVTLAGVVFLFFLLRYQVRRALSERWPHTTARIERDSVRTVGRAGTGSFFRYAYIVHGRRYTGKFLVLDDSEHAELLQKQLQGLPIEVNYNPKDPRVSLIFDIYDRRFAGRRASQNPFWFVNSRERDSLLSLNLDEKDKIW